MRRHPSSLGACWPCRVGTLNNLECSLAASARCELRQTAREFLGCRGWNHWNCDKIHPGSFVWKTYPPRDEGELHGSILVSIPFFIPRRCDGQIGFGLPAVCLVTASYRCAYEINRERSPGPNHENPKVDDVGVAVWRRRPETESVAESEASIMPMIVKM